jgi:uncharacterized protein
MKLQPEKFNVQTISAHGPGWVLVVQGTEGEKVVTSVVLSSSGLRQPWACSRFADLNASHFEPLAQLDCELVIFGSGNQLRFPQPAWLQALMARGIGLETMDTPAACRTYNILAGEGRKVVVALLLEPYA